MTPREALLAAIDGQWWECGEIETEAQLIDYFWRDGAGLAGTMDPALPEQQYHTGPGLSNSGLKKVDRSISHYLDGLREAGSMPTPALVAGRAINDALLQPTVFEDPHRYRVIEPYGRLNPADKKTIAEGHDGAVYLRQTSMSGMGAKVYLAHNGALLDRPTVTPAHDAPICLDKGLADQILRMRVEVMRHTDARAIFTNPETSYEDSFYWLDDETGLLCRSRTDIRPPTGWICDLKSSRDGAPAAFRKQVFTFGYHRQAAHYLDGYERVSGEKPRGFFWLVVSKDEPTQEGVWLPSPDATFLEQGRKETRASLRTFAQWLELAEKVGLADAWTGYPQGIKTIHYYRGNYA